MSRNKNSREGIFAGIGWSYAERLLSQAVSLIVSIILARLLTPDDYGIIAIVMVFISIGDALVNGGLGTAIVQKKDPTELDFNSICWLSFGASAVLYVILFFSAPLIANIYDSAVLVPVIRVMGIKFIFSAWNSVQGAYVQKKMIFKRSFWSSFIGVCVSAVIGVTMAFLNFGVWALIAQYLTHAIISSVVICLTIDWRLKFQFSFKSVKELWSFGVKVLGSTLVFTIRDNIRTLIVGKKFSTDDLAFYNEGQKFPSLLVTDIVNSIGRVIYPVLSEKKDEKEELKSLLRRSVGLSAYILTPMMTGLFVISDTFVKVLLTEKWLPCVPFLRIMCIVYVTRALSTLFQKTILALGKSSLNLIHEVVTSSITLILLLVGAFVLHSVEFIAWSAVITMVVGVVIYAFFVKKCIGYKFREMIADYFPIIFISMIMAAAVYVTGMCQVPNLIKMILQLAMGVIVYLALSILTKNKSFSFLKDSALSMLRKSK